MKKRCLFSLTLFLLLTCSACADTAATQLESSVSSELPILMETSAFDPQSLAGMDEPQGIGKLDENPAGTITRSAVAIPFGKESLSGVALDESFAFRRKLLSETEQKAYDLIYAELTKGNETINLSHVVSQERIRDVWLAVYYDSPELFWVTSGYLYWINNQGHVTKLQITFNDLAVDITKRRTEISSAMKPALSVAKKLSNDEEKVLYIHDYLVNSIEYKKNSPNNQNIYSALINKKTVCAGYSMAFVCLMQELGLPAHVITGYVAAGYHGWNLISIDGAFYNMDITWNDTAHYDAVEYISRAYYNVTDMEISATHTRAEDTVELPACAATEANWFVKNDLIAVSMEDFIARVIENGIANDGNIDIILKLPSKTVYDQTMEMLEKRWFPTIVTPVAAEFSLDPYDYEFTRWYPYKEQLTIDIGIAPVS